MTTSPKAVRFDEDTLWVSLSDGRTIAAPLAWFPRLLEAAPAQRAMVELSKGGLHWEALDEDISVPLTDTACAAFDASPTQILLEVKVEPTTFVSAVDHDVTPEPFVVKN